eukprot:3477706-Pyramimonas_sp.AAC.1
MSPLQSTSCSLGAAAMGNARPQYSRGSDLRSSPQNHALRYHGGSYAEAWGKPYFGARVPPTQLEQKGLRACHELVASESHKIPSN